MRVGVTLLIGWGCLFLWQPAAWPILLETEGKQRIAGYWVREDAKELIVRLKTPDGKEKIQVFDRAKIKILHQVDRKRLEKLAKDNPKAYRDYAEELADQPNDPEAAELAMRLFLIAAYLDPGKLGRPCLLRMSKLAPSAADARKYRAMAFLLDAQANKSLLKDEVIKPGPAAKTLPKALIAFQKALKSYRNGDMKAAREYASEKGAADYFSKSGMRDQKSFLQACSDAICSKCNQTKYVNCTTCNGKGKVVDALGGQEACAACNGKGKQKCSACDGTGVNAYSEEYLQVILRAEVWALDQVLPAEVATKKNAPSASWSRAMSSQPSPVPGLTLETLGEFDPRQCVYRKGTWTTP